MMTAGTPAPFGFVVHPPTLRHVRKAMPAMRFIPDGIVVSLIKLQKPYLISRVRKVSSVLGYEVQGFFVVCPLLPKQMLELDTESVLARIVGAGRIAERLGAKILGLGAYTSIVGDKGVTVASRLSIAVTSGSAMTAWSAVEAIRRLAARRGVDPGGSTLAVIGASGSIGSLCTKVLAPSVRKVIITARTRTDWRGCAVSLRNPARPKCASRWTCTRLSPRPISSSLRPAHRMLCSRSRNCNQGALWQTFPYPRISPRSSIRATT